MLIPGFDFICYVRLVSNSEFIVGTRVIVKIPTVHEKNIRSSLYSSMSSRDFIEFPYITDDEISIQLYKYTPILLHYTNLRVLTV
jgi:hypothetical protein